MDSAHKSYFHFTSKSRLDKAINTLSGIIEGIAIDRAINEREIQFLTDWIDDHKDVENYHPFNELMPVVEDALEDGILSEEEHLDIAWLCDKMTSRKYVNTTTAQIQRLHAILGGIMADGIVTEEELDGLSDWLTDHKRLKTCYPYDEVDTLVLQIMADGKIEDEEQILIKQFFSDFMEVCDDRVITKIPIVEDSTITGLCSICPEITFTDSWFCFTGQSGKYKRKDFAGIVKNLGGRFTNTVRQDLDYLVIGAAGNPCWTYACYGRKVEKAIDLRKSGGQLMIVHEHDFHDAVMDI